MENSKYIVSSTPHIRSNDSISNIMRDVVIALIPATLCAMYFYGMKALLLIAISIGASMLFEMGYQKIAKQEVTVNDYSAIITGLLLAFNLPANTPWWIPVVGAFVAIILVKQIFGGLGQNFMNPALGARAFLLASYPTEMTAWTEPVKNFVGVDTVTTVTPLALLKAGEIAPVQQDYLNALFGNIGGCLGETSAIALLLGAGYLLYKKVITWRIPTAYIGTFFALMLIFGRPGGSYPVYEILLGGLILGAFYMATDYSSSPVTPKGQLIMGVGCGVLTYLIRIHGGYPEGVSYSILLMNLCVPLIERYTRPRVFGTGLKKRGE